MKKEIYRGRKKDLMDSISMEYEEESKEEVGRDEEMIREGGVERIMDEEEN